MQALFGAATIAALSLLVRGQRRALIETYTVSERFIAIEQPGGGRVAIPTDTLARVRSEGDKVRLEGRVRSDPLLCGPVGCVGRGARWSWGVREIEFAAPGGDLLGWDAGAACLLASGPVWVGE